MTEAEIEKLIRLNKSDFDYREWLPLKYAQDWALLNGKEPTGDYIGDYHSHYSAEQREYFLKVMRMMRFMNSVGNSFTPKAYKKGTSSACLIENREYVRHKAGAKEEKDHADIVMPPPAIFGIVLVAGLLLHKCCPLSIMDDPGTMGRTIGSLLFILAGVIMVPTTLLMLRKKTALRPEHKTTTIVTSGFFKYSRNPLYFSLILIFGGVGFYNNLLWLLILLPVLLIALERGVVVHEERYLERLFGEEYLQYKNKVRRWV